VRLLGFGPAGRPFPAVHRPRYSFCAEGRRDARAVAALGFGSSFRSSESLAAGLHLWSLSAWGLAWLLPFGVVGGGRLVVPAARSLRVGPTPCVRFSHRPLDDVGFKPDAPNRIG